MSEVASTRNHPYLSLPQERYYNDTTFHHVVDVLESMLHKAEMTPMEMREAATLACMHYEWRNIDMLRHKFVRGSALGPVAHAEACQSVREAESRLDALKSFLEAHLLPGVPL